MADGFIVINSLKDLEEWEDYEELKEQIMDVDRNGMTVSIRYAHYEEAEQVVEKLKAWKRLKDMNLDIKLLTDFTNKKFRYGVFFGIEDKEDEDLAEIDRNIKLIFGGEE